jgi:hypothetical protein
VLTLPGVCFTVALHVVQIDTEERLLLVSRRAELQERLLAAQEQAAASGMLLQHAVRPMSAPVSPTPRSPAARAPAGTSLPVSPHQRRHRHQVPLASLRAAQQQAARPLQDAMNPTGARSYADQQQGDDEQPVMPGSSPIGLVDPRDRYISSRPRSGRSKADRSGRSGGEARARQAAELLAKAKAFLKQQRQCILERQAVVAQVGALRSKSVWASLRAADVMQARYRAGPMHDCCPHLAASFLSTCNTPAEPGKVLRCLITPLPCGA